MKKGQRLSIGMWVKGKSYTGYPVIGEIVDRRDGDWIVKTPIGRVALHRPSGVVVLKG